VANNFFVKSPTANANDVYEWQADAAPGVPLTSANLDIYNGLFDPLSRAAFANLT
jgi:hypothetical protein